MNEPKVIHSAEDYQRAQDRVAELSAQPGGEGRAEELAALAEALLAFELRRDETVFPSDG